MSSIILFFLFQGHSTYSHTPLPSKYTQTQLLFLCINPYHHFIQRAYKTSSKLPSITTFTTTTLQRTITEFSNLLSQTTSCYSTQPHRNLFLSKTFPRKTHPSTLGRFFFYPQDSILSLSLSRSLSPHHHKDRSLAFLSIHLSLWFFSFVRSSYPFDSPQWQVDLSFRFSHSDKSTYLFDSFLHHIELSFRFSRSDKSTYLFDSFSVTSRVILLILFQWQVELSLQFLSSLHRIFLWFVIVLRNGVVFGFYLGSFGSVRIGGMALEEKE